ncbi:hypothetical protein M9458_044088 [Cirrhinus mrigala]|uniref:TLDc domain-containing protein n=1 Tax=Cirrhinus mrigala TaxID=683832 RepID=A0ABD0NF59_CIRMR
MYQSSGFGSQVPTAAPFTCKLTEGKSKRLRALLGNVKLSLLYKASVNGYKASAFHQRCDRQGPTLLVAYNRSGYIFGGYTSVDYARCGQYITDREAFLFSFQGKIPVCIKINSGHYARLDDAGGPNFGQQLYFCHNNQPVVLSQRGNAFSFNSVTMYGNDTKLTECEVYKISAINKQWRNVLAQLMALIRNHKPLMTSVSRVRILMIGPVGAGKSSFFNSIFMGRITSKAILTTQDLSWFTTVISFSFVHTQLLTIMRESCCHLCCVTPWDWRSNHVQDWILRTSAAFFKVTYQTAIQ